MTAPTPSISIAREAKRTTSHIAVLVSFCGLETRTKLVAKCLADYYNDDLGLSWPSVRRIAAYASCTPNTVRSQLAKLVGMGIITQVAVDARPAHLRRIKSNTWSINASALPPGQIELIDLEDDDSDIPAHAPTLIQHPAGATVAAQPKPIITQDITHDLIWPELMYCTDTPAIVYADGYTPPANLAQEGAIWANEGCSQAAPEPKEHLTPEGNNTPQLSAAPDHQPQASPRRASHAAIFQDCPPGVEPETWTAWTAIRREKRRGLPTEADMAELATQAAKLYGSAPSAVQQALALCVQRRWATLDARWVKPGSIDTASGQRADLSAEARAAQALAERYGLGSPSASAKRTTGTQSTDISHYLAKLSELRNSFVIKSAGGLQ